MSRIWTQVSDKRWVSDDNAVVKIDLSAQCMHSRPWRPNYRGWIAYGPGPEEFNYLKFFSKRGHSVPRKFKFAEKAMLAVDKEFPRISKDEVDGEKNG